MRKFLAPLLILAVAAVAGLVTQHQVRTYQNEEVEKRAFTRLQLFLGLRKTALEDHFRSSGSDVRAMSRNTMVQLTLSHLQTAWSAEGEEASALLRADYITKNPFPVDKRDRYAAVPDGSDYSLAHQQFQPWARRFVRHFGYYDLFLIAADGTVLYTFKKEDDFGTNLTIGPYSSSALGYTFAAAKRFGGRKTAFSDFEEYAPSDGAPAAFAGSAIVGKNDAVIGVFAVQMPSAPIEKILDFNEGLGKTGHTYVVGPDNLLRSQLRFSSTPTLLKQQVKSVSITRAHGGFSGTHIVTNSAGEKVLSAYAPLELQTERWALVAEHTQSENLEAVESRWALAAGGLVALVTVLVLFAFLSLLSAHTNGVQRTKAEP
ncbi:MAG: hypothetical protein GY948_12120 [Alphaproteobacteria bacterium]|nr:hypothetical protein [Alphaproteobacteria bacterium]